MNLTRVIALAIICAGSGWAVSAQSLRDAIAPAEFPPSSFTGNQYVDSKGCVFIRAGVDGSTTWVPRVNRDRTQICGAQPSLAGTRTAAPVRTAPPVQITPAAPRPAATAAAPAPRPVATVSAPAPRAQPQPVAVAPRTAAQPVVRQPVRPAAVQTQQAPRQVAPVPARVPAQTPKRSGLGGNCPGASSLSNYYINRNDRLPVRCGPQQNSSLGRAGAGVQVAGVARGQGADATRILPVHVYKQNLKAQNVSVPEGYKLVWEDDRLNPRRAEQSVAGHMRSQQIWTHTVPRQLVDPAKPATIVPPRIVERPRGLEQAPVIATKGATASPRPHQAAKAPPPKQTVLSGRFVQVALYTTDASARSAAQKMARTGVPVRLGTLARGGKSYRMVLAGPFTSRGDADRAVAAARKAGFANARLR